MKFIRFVLALTALATAATAAIVLTKEPTVEPARVSAAQVPAMSTTTTEPDFAALAVEGPSNSLQTEEIEATAEAVSRVTSTTTTTTAPTSTSTTAVKKSTTTTTAPKATSTTEAKAKTTETTAAKKSTTTTEAPKEEPAGGFSSRAESGFASAVNGYRSSKGLSGLSRDGSLDSYARSWAKKIAERGELSHSSIGSLLPPWSSAGENVAVGSSVGQIHDALVASSSHRENMLGEFTHMGIGVWVDGDGLMWTAEVFTR